MQTTCTHVKLTVWKFILVKGSTYKYSDKGHMTQNRYSRNKSMWQGINLNKENILTLKEFHKGSCTGNK